MKSGSRIAAFASIALALCFSISGAAFSAVTAADKAAPVKQQVLDKQAPAKQDKAAPVKTVKKAPEKTTAKLAPAGTVYVTKGGTKYHRADCKTIAKSKEKTALSVAQAKEKKYEPCKVCNPN